MNQPVCIACSIFKKEVEVLKQKGQLHVPVTFLDSMMHLEPEKLHRLLDKQLKEQSKNGNPVLLLFGECHPYSSEQTALPGVHRTTGTDCIELLLGRKKYRTLKKKGYFFLLPEWAIRWKEVVDSNFETNGKGAHEAMTDKHSKLVYLDTGLTPVPKQELKDFSEYSGLPWEVMKVKLDHLKNVILDTLKKLSQSKDSKKEGPGHAYPEP